MTTGTREWFVPAAVVATSVGLSALAGLMLVEDAQTVTAVVLVVAAAALFAFRPVIGLVAVVATLPLQELLLVANGITMTKALAPVICAVWVVRKVALRESWRPGLFNPMLPVALLLAGFALLSSVWAVYPERAVSASQRLIFFVIWASVVSDLASSPRALKAVAQALVTAGLVAAALTLHQYFGEGVRRAGAGVSGGVDYTSTLLVTLIPLGFYLMLSRSARTGWRLLACAFVVSAVAAVVVTFARMNMLVLPPLLALLVWESLRESGRRQWGVLLFSVVAVLAATVVPWGTVLDRASTIGPELAAMFSGESMGGRGFHYRVGFAILGDHLLLGAGFDSYGVLFLRDYQYLLPSSEGYLYGSVRSTHSSFLAMMAELGVVGTALWLALIGTILYLLFRAWRAAGGDAPIDRDVVRAYAYALGLQMLVYGWYSNIHKDSFFWTLVGVAVGVWHLATQNESPARDGS